VSGAESADGQGGPVQRVDADADSPDAPPPILGSWRRAYALLVVELAVTVLALYALAWWAA
jgi:hypothetical protein